MCGERHTIHAARRHYGWDNARPPVARVEPGQTLRFECRDASDGHFGPDSSDADVATLDPARVNPVTGPIRVEGAEPGDALKATIGDFEPSGAGWTANIPGFGLLADQFPEPRRPRPWQGRALDHAGQHTLMTMPGSADEGAKVLIVEDETTAACFPTDLIEDLGMIGKPRAD